MKLGNRILFSSILNEKGKMRMNYIKELNAFREWLLFNELPAGAVALWYTLMSINNVTRWKQKFNAPNAVVGQLSGLSRQGVLDARNKLLEHELIRCEKGKKGVAPVYEMISLIVDTSLDTTLDTSADKPLTIHKQKQKKDKERREEEAGPLVTTYEQNIGKLSPLTREAFLKWTDVVGEGMMLEAIRFASKHHGRTFSYLESILQEWEEAKLKTVEDVKVFGKQKKSLKKNTIAFQPSKRLAKKSLFDELREEVGG